MDRAITAWLQQCHPKLPDQDSLVEKLSPNYTIYGSMLLLPAKVFDTEPWHTLPESSWSSEHLDNLYSLLCKHLKVTHIATTQPILLRDPATHSLNVMRSPTNFTPLYGDFGPASCGSPPTTEDFSAAYWVTAKQHGIAQTWAPRWTMFSRGNITEKARILTLPSVRGAVEQGQADGKRTAAIDLYAGIGYFAFSYLRAGVATVLCWDVNPWSIEGLKKGAVANRWTWKDGLTGNDIDHLSDSKANLIVFPESNELARVRIEALREVVPPVRHVNCGLLPSSRGSWETAFHALDPALGGWVHVHENFKASEVVDKAEEVRKTFQVLGADRLVVLDYINRLKSYAPGVVHCVLDISIGPPNPV